MPARLSHDGASDAVCAADRAQRVGGEVLAFRIGDGVMGADRNRADTGRRDVAVLCLGSAGDVEPAVYPAVAPVSDDYGGRVERGVGGGVATEQRGDGL